MRVGLSKILVSAILTASIVHPGLANDFDFVFDEKNSQLGSGGENTQSGAGETRLSWRLDSRILPTQHKGSVGFIYRDDYKKRRKGYETSLSWKLQSLTLTSTFSKSWINQDRKDRQLEVMDTWYIIESNYNLSARPYSGVFLSYGSGSRQRNKFHTQLTTNEEALTDMQAKFRLNHEILNFSVGAGQYRLQNDALGIEEQIENRLFVKGKLFPEYPVSLLPSFRLYYKTESALGLTRNFEKKETALGLIYKPIQSPYSFSIKTAYENWVIPDANEDREVLKFAAKIDWKQEQNRSGSSSDWSIDYQLKDIRDNINPNARSSDWSISLIWSMPIG